MSLQNETIPGPKISSGSPPLSTVNADPVKVATESTRSFLDRPVVIGCSVSEPSSPLKSSGRPDRLRSEIENFQNGFFLQPKATWPYADDRIQVRYIVTFFVCAVLAVVGTIVWLALIIPAGEGAFGMAKAVPFMFVLASLFGFCIVWLPANVGVYIWDCRRKRASSSSSLVPLLLSGLAFALCLYRIGSTWLPAWRQEHARQHYDSLAQHPANGLNEVKELIDSYSTESQRGLNTQPPSGRYGSLRILIDNPSTTPELLSYLADRLDDNAVLLWFIAQSSNCPPNLINRCLAIPAAHEYLAMNPAASPPLLETLSLSTNWQVRMRVAQNHNTPDSLLERLGTDTNFSVSDSVERSRRIRAGQL